MSTPLIKGMIIPFNPVTRALLTDGKVTFMYNPNKVTTSHKPSYQFNVGITGNQAFAQYGSMSPQVISFSLFLRSKRFFTLTDDNADITEEIQSLNYLATPLDSNQGPPMAYLYLGNLVPTLAYSGVDNTDRTVTGVVSSLNVTISHMSRSLYPTQASVNLDFTISRRKL